MGGYSFEITNQKNIDWKKIESCYDHTVFKTKEWMDFLIETQSIDPFVLKIIDKDQLIGFFVGEKFTKLFNIVASPFEGWTTSYQGLSMLIPISNEDRIIIYKDLINFLFKNRICSVFQASDWQLDLDAVKNSGLRYEIIRSYRLDLTQTEDQIYKKFSSSSCQYSIRKSQKNGVVIRKSEDIDQFVQQYYTQLTEVFEKQKLKPTYKIDRIGSLIEKLDHSENILLLEAVSSEGICIATGIFIGDNNLAYFWGGASYTKYQSLCPNEPIMYEAIKYWKRNGYKEFDLGGIRKYKEKYGPDYIEKPKIVASKYQGILELKNIAKKAYYGLRELRANFKKVY